MSGPELEFILGQLHQLRAFLEKNATLTPGYKNLTYIFIKLCTSTILRPHASIVSFRGPEFFTLMRIRIQLFTRMQIRIRI